MTQRIPLNGVNYESSDTAIEAIGQYGSGMKPPTYLCKFIYDLNNIILKNLNCAPSFKEVHALLLHSPPRLQGAFRPSMHNASDNTDKYLYIVIFDLFE